MSASPQTKIRFASFSVGVMVLFGTVMFMNSPGKELKLSDKENPLSYQGITEEQTIITTKVPRECLKLAQRVVDRSGKYPRIWETSSLFEYDDFNVYQVRMVYGNYDKMFISDCKINNHGNVESFRILSWKNKEVIKILK